MIRIAIRLFLAGLAAQSAWAAEGSKVPPRPQLPAGVPACESCHGARGEGSAAQNAPRLAGQSASYMARQLAAFADGSRNNPVMAPMAKMLDARLRDELAAYYTALETPAGKAAGKASERGKVLATVGDHAKGIQACANCHGPYGIGEPPGYPYLAGQQPAYVAATLKAWRDGSRRTDPTGQMPAIAKRLDEGDIAALADYYASLKPPPAGMFRAGEAPVPATGSAGSAAAPKPPAGQPGGAGMEQGAPTTGGGQGPGGGGGR